MTELICGYKEFVKHLTIPQVISHLERLLKIQETCIRVFNTPKQHKVYEEIIGELTFLKGCTT